MRRIILNAAFIGALFVSVPVLAQEHPHGGGEASQPIISIMQGMNENMRKLVSAIMVEDYHVIASAAYDIANHPGIDEGDLHKLFERLGLRKESFIACDSAVHNLAEDVSEAGEQEDMGLVLEKFYAMLTKTTQCHREYKPKIGNEE